MKFKGTPGKLEMKFMKGGICIGIGTVGDYCQITANSILPETDEEYEKEKEELEANMRLYAASPLLLKELKRMTLSMQAHPDCEPNSEFQDYVNSAWEAIEKALKL